MSPSDTRSPSWVPAVGVIRSCSNLNLNFVSRLWFAGSLILIMFGHLLCDVQCQTKTKFTPQKTCRVRFPVCTLDGFNRDLCLPLQNS